MTPDTVPPADLHPHLEDRRSLAASWFGVLAAPIAWSVQLVLGDAFAEVGCEAGGFSAISLVLLAISAAAGLIAIAGFVTAWREFRATGSGGGPGTRLERARFMAIAGMLSSGLFLLLIVLGGVVPHLFLSTCDGT